MDPVLLMLKTIPEYVALTQALSCGETAAVTGVGQINRSHMIAGIRQDVKQKLVILVQDEMAAHRMQEELKCFLHTEVPMLPGRDLTLYDAADSNVKAIFINIFGGIMKCDIIAQGVVDAASEMNVGIPIIVRLEGTNAHQGRDIIEKSGLSIIPAIDMADGAMKAIAAAKDGCKAASSAL